MFTKRGQKMDLTELYCNIDDFWKYFKQEWDKHLIDRGIIKDNATLFL